MNRQPNDVASWEREYLQIQSIPSSTRTLPSKALCIVAPLIDFSTIGRIFDAGCGNGRNAIFLAEMGCRVTAADFARAALQATIDRVAQERLESQIKISDINLFEKLPYDSSSFDMCLDSYVSCHFTNRAIFHDYWSELARVTRSGGLIYTSMFGDDDEYYAKLKEPADGHSLATDPYNRLTKVLYSETQFKGLFPSSLSIMNFLKFQFSDNVHGQDYSRSLLVALLQKRD